MTVPSDLSLMDFLFDREDPLLSISDKDSSFKSEYKDSEIIGADSWACNPDDFLDSLLKFEEHPFELLQNEEPDNVGEPSVAASSCSDSGLSSDQQLSPMLPDTEEEVEEHSPMDVQQEIELDTSVFNVLDTSSLGDVKIEDNQAVISMNVLSIPEQSETITVRNIQNKRVSTGVTPIRQVIRVTPVSGNPRSILLPVNLKDMKEIKTIKIINSGSSARMGSSVTTLHTKPVIVKSKESREEVTSQYPRLQLTTEEKRLIQKEGVRLPSHYPLTKHEERELKRIRRKIRNKISAQDSRKRKKEYIDGLEDRVKQCTDENVNLVKRIKALQTQNQSLTTQLKRLQALLARSTTKSVQPATCLMVLMLSMALIMAPSLRPDGSGTNTSSDVGEHDLGEVSPASGRSRSLLFSKAALPDEGIPITKEEENRLASEVEEMLQYYSPLLDDHDYDPPPAKFARMLEEEPPYVVPPLPGGEKGQAFLDELKVNSSDGGGTRTVLLQVPHEQ